MQRRCEKVVSGALGSPWEPFRHLLEWLETMPMRFLGRSESPKSSKSGATQKSVPTEEEELEDLVEEAHDLVAEAAEEVAEEAQVVSKKPKGRFWGLSSKAESSSQLWEFSVSISRFQFVGSETKIPCFFAVSLQPSNPRSKSVRLLTQYSPKYDLEKASPLVLRQASIFYERKAFKAKQSDLGRLELKVAMWRVSRWSFNSFYGLATRSLDYILSREANTSIRLSEALTQKERDEKKKNRRRDIMRAYDSS